MGDEEVPVTTDEGDLHEQRASKHREPRAPHRLRVRGRGGARASGTCDRALIIVDYVQLLCPEHSTGNRDYEMAAAIRTLVNTAKVSNASIVLVSQLNRRSADRADPRPRLVDLRESGALEAAATAVLFIHAPEDPDMPHEVILAKHRRSSNTIDDFYFDPSTGTFRLVDQTQADQPAH